MQSYSASKLGNVLFTYESQRRMASLGVQVNRTHCTAESDAAELSAPCITAARITASPSLAILDPATVAGWFCPEPLLCCCSLVQPWTLALLLLAQSCAVNP